jgi:hypothetical protein
MLNKIRINLPREVLFVYIVLTVATLAVFWQVNGYDFVNFDDDWYIIKNGFIKSGMTPEGLGWAFSTRYFGLWNPLLWCSFMLDYQFYGLHAGGYHLTNLVLHIFSVYLLFWLFHHMTVAVWKSAFVAALFALHPLHVESVAWVAERKDVLSAFFWMLTLCLYVHYTEKPVISRYLLVVFSFVCALLSKPMVITLPFMMLLLDYWPLGRIQHRKTVSDLQDVTTVSTSHARKKPKSNAQTLKKNISSSNATQKTERRFAGIIPAWQLWEKAPFFFLAFVVAVITFYNPHASDELYLPALQEFPLVSRLANAPVAFVMYLGKTFWPQDMTIFYPFMEHIPLWQIIGSALLIIIISVAVIATAKRTPHFFVGWFWFAITMVPVIGIIQISQTTPYAMADRYHYLPSIGMAVLLAWGVPSFMESDRVRKRILFPAAIIFLAVMGLLSWRQCGYWQNSITLWNHSLQVVKHNYLAHHNMGLALFDQGKFKEAVEHYSEAIRLKPDEAVFRYNRGNAYAKLDRHQQAIEDYHKAIDLKPYYTEAYHNRGLTYARLERYDLAIADYDEVIRRKPNHFNAYYNKACSYALQNNAVPACGWLCEAINRGFHDGNYLQNDKDFDKIRNESCFLALLQKSKK